MVTVWETSTIPVNTTKTIHLVYETVTETTTIVELDPVTLTRTFVVIHEPSKLPLGGVRPMPPYDAPAVAEKSQGPHWTEILSIFGCCCVGLSFLVVFSSCSCSIGQPASRLSAFRGGIAGEEGKLDEAIANPGLLFANLKMLLGMEANETLLVVLANDWAVFGKRALTGLVLIYQ
jgi:hypothetical protein